MNYFVINDGISYKIAKPIINYKNHTQVEIIPENITKKIRNEQQIFPIETNGINIFIENVSSLTSAIDTELLNELIDDTQCRYSITELAELYFGSSYSDVQKTALLFAIHKNQIQFIDYLNGFFSKCSIEEQTKRITEQKLKEQEQKIINDYYTQLINQKLPDVDEDVIKLLSKPNKHAPLYKALNLACQYLKQSPLEVCVNAGLINNLPEFFLESFLLENFARKEQPTILTNDSDIYPIDKIPLNLNLQVFSIDDKNTTEIDDAFSVEYLENGYQIGIHIAAPALNASLEEFVAENISTVYYPCSKITMLPQEIIDQYSLTEGKVCPVVSIYFKIDLDLNVIEYFSNVEQVKIDKNLRIEELELLFNTENINNDHNYPYEKELKILYKFAIQLETNRGKPSVNSLIVDYQFNFIHDKISIKPRLRGNPIDKLVSELMILANCTWGRMLTNAFISAIYRVKRPNYPVTMTLNPDSHTGLNVSYYTWATSPLRRSADYINQHQIICLNLKLKNSYTNTNATLLETVNNFDSKYSKYIEFQNKMERYWSLKFLLQENINELIGTFVYNTRVILEGVPLELDLKSLTDNRHKGTKIKLAISKINLTTLEFDIRIIGEITTP